MTRRTLTNLSADAPLGANLRIASPSGRNLSQGHPIYQCSVGYGIHPVCTCRLTLGLAKKGDEGKGGSCKGGEEMQGTAR